MLLTVLDELPIDVVRENVWDYIDVRTQGNLRQSCRQSRALADELVTDVTLRDSAHDGDEDSDLGIVPGQRAELEAWHHDAMCRAQYLSKPTRLVSLTLSAWPSESALALLLRRYGQATQGRLLDLTLKGAFITFTTSCAILTACPQLRSLNLASSEDREGTIEVLSGDILLPLCSLPTLSHVSSSRSICLRTCFSHTLLLYTMAVTITQPCLHPCSDDLDLDTVMSMQTLALPRLQCHITQDGIGLGPMLTAMPVVSCLMSGSLHPGL